MYPGATVLVVDDNSDERTDRTDRIRDVTQQRDALQRLLLQREQLVAFVVHDLKNPVGAIDLHVELLLRDPEASERTRRLAGRIRDEGRALLEMITMLLDVAQADEGKLVITRTLIDLDALIDGTLDALDAKARAAELRFRREGGGCILSADANLVRRVLENLVENAMRYAPRDSEICVIARPSHSGIELRVRDAGPGIPVDERERVFERYAKGLTEEARGNHGLGLAFCKLAIEAHGGRIWIEDAAPGATLCAWFAQHAPAAA